MTNINDIHKMELQQLKETYVNHIIDGMDMNDLMQMAFDLLLDAYHDCTWEQVTDEIVDLYGEDTLIQLLPEGNTNE